MRQTQKQNQKDVKLHSKEMDEIRDDKDNLYYMDIGHRNNVGDKISVQLAREHAGLDYDYANLERALVIKLRSPKISDYIKAVVSGLESMGIEIDKPKKKETMTGTIYVCMTGSPKPFGFPTKAEFIAKFPMVEEVSITDKKCQYLITDSYNSTSNKMGVANKKGITIKTYGDFKI